MRHLLSIALAATLTLSSCLNPSDPVREVRPFRLTFEPQNNVGLGYLATTSSQGDNAVGVKLPDSVIVGSLVATMDRPDVDSLGEVTVDGQPWLSEQTPLNFASPKTFVLTAPNGTVHSFLVEVELCPYELGLVSFLVGDQRLSFPMAPNLSLTKADAVLMFNLRLGDGHWLVPAGIPTGVLFDGEQVWETLGRGVLVRQVDFSLPHTITVLNGDRTSKEFALEPKWYPLVPTRIQLRKSDNSNLNKDFLAVLSYDTNTAVFDLPSDLDLSQLKVYVEHNGLRASVGGITTDNGTVTVDLFADQPVHLSGSAGVAADWTLTAKD